MPSLVPGSRIGPYEILALIGAGGMGQVWKARDTRLERIVAIKVAQEKFSERFEREARTVAALNHPNICTLYDVGADYLVMEYIEGTPLQGPLPLDQALKYATQICDALDAAHKKHIIHRDLKPANILVTKSGVKLLDFGLAKISSQDASNAVTSPVTQHGMVLGTLQYMSPEQLEGNAADARSDIYSLGLVLYEMVTGKRASPHSGLAPLEPPALEHVIKTCLAKDPDARWQTAREVNLGLQWTTRSETTAAAGSAPARRRWRERPAWIAAMVVLTSLSWFLGTLRRTSGAVDVTRFAISPPEGTDWAGEVYATLPVPQFALSPDGRSVVFVAAAVGSAPMLWLRSMQDVAARVLPGTENAQSPFWSPDSHWIGFFADGNLKKAPVPAGAVQVIAEGIVDARGGSWGPDDTILFATSGSAIFRVSAFGGTGVPVTTLDTSQQEGGHRWPQFLPDGRHFLYTVLGAIAEQRGIYVGSLDGKTKKLVLRPRFDTNAFYATPGYLLFVDGDSLLAQAFDAARLEPTGAPFTVAERVGRSTAYSTALSVSSSGTLAYAGPILRSGRLTWFDRAGKPGKSIGPEGDYTDFRLSHDEQRLAASLVDPKVGSPDIWITDIARGGEERFTRGTAVNATAIWSPDSTQILFRTFRNGVIELYLKSAAGGGTEEAAMTGASARAAGLEGISNIVPSDWSPDGQHVIFSVPAKPTGYDLWLLPVTGDGKPTGFISSPGAMHANFSPDGRLLAYTSNESGKLEVYVQTVPLSDRKRQASIGGGYEPRWGRDGNELYYLSDDRKLMAVAVSAGPTLGTPTPLFQTGVVPGVTSFRTNYVPTRDGRRFLIKTQGSEPAPNPITVVLNWQSGLSAGETR